MRTAVATMASTWLSSDTSTVTGGGRAPGGHDLGHGGLGLIGHHVGHHHLGTLGGEEGGRHPSDAAAGPGDHGDFAVQTCHLGLPLGPRSPVHGLRRERGTWSRVHHSSGTLPGGRYGGGILSAVSTAGPRPLIGVTTYRQTTSWWSWERDAALVPGPYLDVIDGAGGEALLLPPPGVGIAPHGAARYQRVVEALDGLVVIGGGDLDAARYGADADPRNGGTSAQRDELELGLIRAALAIDLPLLAVCRGLQVLNVCLGGDLVQQLPDRLGTSAHQPRPGAFGPVTVTTAAGSTVHRLLGARTEVLCSHHQAVDRLGEGLVVTARSQDGVVEAVELPGHRFVVGVQWHPEENGDRRLFSALVDAATARIEHSSTKEPA